jgi:hypothetical protein
MAETWDLSLLIDLSTRIYDARGMAGQHLGLEARFLPDRLFIDFVDPANRGAFRRRLVKMESGKLDIVRVSVITGSEGSQEFFAALRPSNSDGRKWLMLAASVRDETAPLAALERTGLAAGDEFMMLVEGAARQLNGEVDLMQVRAELLTDQGAAASTTLPAVREQLESSFDEIVVENAFDNIATRPQPGEYLMLKERARPAEDVLNELGAAAERLSIPAADLGLATRTVRMETLTGNFSQASLDGLVFDLRHDPSLPAQQWEPERRSWLASVIRSATHAVSAIMPAREVRSPRTDR